MRVPGAAQGRLGLPRAAGRARGRKAARHLLQAGDRGVRDRRVQRALPRVGLRVRRGVEPADRADRLLDRPRRSLCHPRGRLHRVGLVVVAKALGRRAALRGPQGRALLPALRHGALLARGRARLRGRQGPLDIRSLPAAGRPRRRDGRVAADLDDHSLDAAGQPRGRGGARGHLRQGAGRRRDADPRRAAGREGAGRGGRDRRSPPGAGSGRPPLHRARSSISTDPSSPAAFRSSPEDFVTTEDGTGLVHIAPAFGEDDYRVARANGLFDPTVARHPSTTRSTPTAPSTTESSASRGSSSRTPSSPAR